MAVLKAAANIARALARIGKKASLCLAMPECNSFGLGLLSGRGLDAAIEDAQAGADVAIILENDLYRRLEIDRGGRLPPRLPPCGRDRPPVSPDRAVRPTWCCRRRPSPKLTGPSSTTKAGPSAISRYFPPDGQVRPSWQWLKDVMAARGMRKQRPGTSLDGLISFDGKGGPPPRPRGRRRASGDVPGCGDADSPRAPAGERKDGRERSRDRARAADRRRMRTRLSPFPWRAMAEGRLRP